MVVSPGGRYDLVELDFSGSSPEVVQRVLEGGYSEVDSPGGGYGLLIEEDPGSSEESVSPGEVDEGYATLEEDPGSSVV